MRVGAPLTTGNLALSPGLGRGAWRFDDHPVSKMVAFQPGATVYVRSLQRRVYGLMAICGRLCILVGSGSSRTGTAPTIFRVLCGYREGVANATDMSLFFATSHEFSRTFSDFGVLVTGPATGTGSSNVGAAQDWQGAGRNATKERRRLGCVTYDDVIAQLCE